MTMTTEELNQFTIVDAFEILNDITFRCDYLHSALNMLKETIEEAENKDFTADEIFKTIAIYSTYSEHIANDIKFFHDTCEKIYREQGKKGFM